MLSAVIYGSDVLLYVVCVCVCLCVGLLKNLVAPKGIAKAIHFVETAHNDYILKIVQNSTFDSLALVVSVVAAIEHAIRVTLLHLNQYILRRPLRLWLVCGFELCVMAELEPAQAAYLLTVTQTIFHTQYVSLLSHIMFVSFCGQVTSTYLG